MRNPALTKPVGGARKLADAACRRHRLALCETPTTRGSSQTVARHAALDHALEVLLR
jgi:hypothetical protein